MTLKYIKLTIFIWTKTKSYFKNFSWFQFCINLQVEHVYYTALYVLQFLSTGSHRIHSYNAGLQNPWECECRAQKKKNNEIEE